MLQCLLPGTPAESAIAVSPSGTCAHHRDCLNAAIALPRTPSSPRCRPASSLGSAPNVQVALHHYDDNPAGLNAAAQHIRYGESMHTRRESLLYLFAGYTGLSAGLARGAEMVYLAAHRGGVVDEAHAENSAASIQAAIARGYSMIEVDVRATRDGEPILQHDATFQRYFGDPRRPEEMLWTEVQRLRSTPGDRAPLHFEEMCALAQGKLRLMLDMKGNNFPKPYLQRIEDTMRKHGLLEGSCTLGGGAVKDHFAGKILLSIGPHALQEAAARGESVASRYFLFALGSVMDKSAIALCRQHGVMCMAAINTFRYEMAKVDHWQGAESDIRRLRALGVRHFQIDSIYDKFLL